MAIVAQSDFDRSRRRLYYELRPFPTRIGAVKVAEESNGKLLPVLLPYSQVTTPDGVVYYETNPFYAQVNSAEEITDLVFNPQMWGVVEAIEYNHDIDVHDVAPSEGQVRPDPEALLIHRFGFV